MESLLKSVTLTQDVVRVLDEIRAGAENALYGAESGKSEELFAKHIVSLVEGAGLPVLQTMHYRWFLRELARLWRTRTGRDLAFHLELCIRKWVGLGLEPRTLQFLVCEAHERLKGKELTTKSQRHEENPDQSATKARKHEGEGETRALECGSAAPAFPDRTNGPERAAAVLPHSTELRSQSAKSAESVDALSEPQICVHRRSSVVDSPAPQSAKSAESVESVDDIPDSTAKDAKYAKTEPESATKARKHEGEGETRALECGSAAPAFPDRTNGPERAAAVLPHSTELRSQSADDSSSAPGILESSTPGVL